MVRAGSNNRQPEGDVHRLIKSLHLDRDQPLIVIHGHDQVVSARNRIEKDRVRGEGALRINALLLGSADGRLNDAIFLIPELAVL